MRCLLHKAVLGGEGSGGVIDPRVGLVRDSFVGMVLLLDAMAERGMTIEPTGRRIAALRNRQNADSAAARKAYRRRSTALEQHFADAKADRLDGLRLDWPDRWLLVRPSNTEPIVGRWPNRRSAAESSRLLAEAAEGTEASFLV